MFDSGRNRGWILLAALLLLAPARSALAQRLKSPQPGEVYREYTVVMLGADFRVTDPNAPYVGVPGNSPSDFLPNPVFPLRVTDLVGAVRAEALIDVWGGHTGTTGQAIRFNNHPWIELPKLATAPEGKQECYQQQWNVVVDVPLADLVQGTNFLDATAGPQTCYNFGWGQWGWYGLTLRVYYAPTKAHVSGSIVSPLPDATLHEDPTLVVETSGDIEADRVEFLAYYDGYDTDGDGYYLDYHESYQRTLWGSKLDIKNHVGTVESAPWRQVWDTELVPDQPLGQIKILARIRGTNGLWFVTDEVTGLSLLRPDSTVQLYKPENIPQRYWVRDNALRSSIAHIPADHPIDNVVSAKLLVRTWNGIDGMAEPGQEHYTKVNHWVTDVYGENHHFQYDVVDVDPSALIHGDNTIAFWSQSIHHGVEILWPGPALLVRYGQVLPFCGDGITDGLEDCDDANPVNGDGCSTDCRLEFCGDGVVQAGLGEACDDGDILPGDGCDAVCQPEPIPPSIVGQPHDQILLAGQAATFGVDVEGTAPLTYRWQRWNGGAWDDIPGASTSSYTLAPVQLAHNGSLFRCAVSNSMGSEVSDSARLTVVETGRVDDGLIALYRFDEGVGQVVHDVSGYGQPLDLEIPDPARVTWLSGGGLRLNQPTQVVSSGPASKITDAVSASNALTVEGWLRPGNLTQNGPARIATISDSPTARNFTLGQGVWDGSSEVYDARLRSTGTSTNGTPSLSTPDGTLTTGLTHVVYTRDSSGTTRLFIDGAQEAVGVAGGNLSGWDRGYRLALGEEFESTTRSWLGSYELLAFYDRALDTDEVLRNFIEGPVHCADGECDDACPGDPSKSAPGICGCGVLDTDSDADGVADCQDFYGGDPYRAGPVHVMQVTVNHGWKTYQLPATYLNPVVIAGIPSTFGGQPGVARVNAVTADSFQIKFQEWRHMDGYHFYEEIAVLVLEAGRYEMPDGSVWEAGITESVGNRRWASYGFSQAFAGVPELLLSHQTSKGADPVTMRARSVTSSGFEAAQFEEEALLDGHLAETVGYLAILSPGSGGMVSALGGDLPYTLEQVQMNQRWTPVHPWVIKLQEDQSADTEVRHAMEQVSVLSLDGHPFGQCVTDVEPDTFGLRYQLEETP